MKKIAIIAVFIMALTASTTFAQGSEEFWFKGFLQSIASAEIIYFDFTSLPGGGMIHIQGLF